MQQKMIFVLLFAFVFIGGFLRLHALSPFKFYPDAYQNLLVAQNIRTYGSVVGTLGPEGMVYPPFVMWSRPGYALMINGLMRVGIDESTAAQSLSVGAGIFAIPLAFLAVRAIFKSNAVGLSAALLTTLSFNHTVWSGYIMTETTGVCILLLFFWLLFRSLEDKTDLANATDILIGMIFGYAILVRYEYALLIIPVFLLLWQKASVPFIKTLNIITGTLLILAIAASLLFPIRETYLLVTTQNQSLLMRGGVLSGLLLCGFGIYQYWLRRFSTLLSLAIQSVTHIVIFGVVLLLLLQITFPTFSFLRTDLGSLRDFLRDDFVLLLSFLTGAVSLLRLHKDKVYVYFSLIALILLGVLYHRVNSEMERYWTHLLPFFLIPASYVFTQIINTVSHKQFSFEKKFYLLLPVIAICIWQITITYQGFRNWGDKSWYRTSYEEKSAQMLARRIQTNNQKVLLIASFPEPYHYTTGLSTHSIADTFPYIFVDNGLDNRPVVIIHDMGMRDIFPQFSQFLTKHMQDFQTSSYVVGEPYHFSFRSEKEKYPVVIYRTNLQTLKEKIAKSAGQ